MTAATVAAETVGVAGAFSYTLRIIYWHWIYLKLCYTELHRASHSSPLSHFLAIRKSVFLFLSFPLHLAFSGSYCVSRTCVTFSLTYLYTFYAGCKLFRLSSIRKLQTSNPRYRFRYSVIFASCSSVLHEGLSHTS